MEKLNDYLKTLLSTCSYELHLEPNETPYIIDDNGKTDVDTSPLLGTQISTIIFPLIPNDAKRELPNKSEIEFVHNHNLGNFNFIVKKSPSGFNVTISPMLSDFPRQENSTESTDETPDETEAPKRDFSNANSEIAQKLSSLSETLKKEKEAREVFGQNNGHQEIKTEISSQNFSLGNTPTQFESSENSYSTDFSDDDYDSTYEIEDIGDSIPALESTFQMPKQKSPSDNESGTVISPIEYLESYLEEQEKTEKQQKEKSFSPATENPQARERMDDLFHKMAEAGASDLHLSVSMPPMIRKDGKIRKLRGGDTLLLPKSTRELLMSIMPEKNREEFERRHDTDFAYEIEGLARFRANVFMDRKGMGGVFRIIPSDILTAKDLGLSKAIMDLCSLSKGLVVVTGPTGSGKSTTLCAMIDAINDQREDHIITIEDPIEFTHENKKCLINQREVGNHTDSFKDALRAALREDPDILLVGEMRDLETISIAIETAETGHLVFGTLHTTTAASTVDRIIDQFPADRQQQVRVMLSESLRGVIAQTLLPKKGGGRIAALEILIVTPAISNLIREGKTFQIASSMQTGKNKGMVMLNDALYDLVEKDLVEPRDAYIKAVDKASFETLLQRGGYKI
jgi:twitching motility protein PilT